MNPFLIFFSIILVTSIFYIGFLLIGFAGVSTNIKAQGLEEKLKE